jgi:hypothetical protein
MSERHGDHPLSTAIGLFAFALWALYSLYAALNYPDILTSVLVGASFGVVACLALVFNLRYWRSVVLLASSVYLLLYLVRIVRMTAIRPDLSFFSALYFYYSASWRVVAGTFEERGWAGGLTHAYLEYAMPVLAVVLITVMFFPRRGEMARDGPIERSKSL